MNKQKQWYSLDELSSILGCTEDHILYLGIMGELTLSFDWLVLKSESDSNFCHHGTFFRFYEIVDSYYDDDRKCNRDLTTYVDVPDCQSNPMNRLAVLSPNQVALLKKLKELIIKSAYVDDIQYFDIELPENLECAKYPKIGINDIVVTAEAIIAYENKVIKNELPFQKELSVNNARNNDDISDALYVANCLSTEVWPLPENMNRPTKNQLVDYIKEKGFEFTDSEIDSIIRVSLPKGQELGGKPNKSKDPFQPVLLRKK